MSFVNVGALVSGQNATTKKALREALASDPASVTFYATAMAEVEQIKDSRPLSLRSPGFL